jgi:glycosyltransferase involved in cell wall biosynthesis
MGKEAAKSRRVAVVYHYFAHYRRPVFFDLIENSPHHYEFLGCDHAFGSGIKLIEDFPEGRFRKVRGWQPGPFLLQPAVVWAACSSRYDTLVLLGDSKWPTTWLAAAIGRLRGKRVLMWTHGWLREEHGLKRLFRDTFYKLSNGLLLYNRRARAIGISHGFRPEQMHVIYNSLDTESQSHVRDSITGEQVADARSRYFPGRESHPILTTVARLMPAKKIGMLVDAAAILEKQGTPVNVLIVGDGPEKEMLIEKAKSGNVTANITGAIYDEETLGKIFLASELTVMPGPIGLLVMHSLVYGTPMITHDNIDTQMPEFEAIVDGVTGAVFIEDDVESLAEAISKWLNDPSIIQRHKQRSSIVRFGALRQRSRRMRMRRIPRGGRVHDLKIKTNNQR